MNPKAEPKKRARLLAALLIVAAAAALPLLPAGARAQAKKPITLEGLVKAVRINGLSTSELVQQVQSRGVSFQMTQAAEAELLAAGARPEVIEAARANYRAGGAAPVANASARGRSNVPRGEPLSKGEVVTMLQAGTPPARVEEFVEARGVNFQSNAQTAREIKAAGGTNSLVGAIAAGYAAPGRARTPPVRPGRPAAPPPARGPDYDDLTDQATAAYDAKNAARATQLLTQAIQLDASQPRAYQLLGFTQLYLQNDIAAAEKNMRKAIDLGGSATFRVFHDHGSGTFTQTCSGTLFVTKTNVTFKADDGRDTFETEDTNVKEIKLNSFAGRAFGMLLGGKDLGAFHIKPRQKINGRDNFNFAPLTKKKAESELIITLVKAYGGVQG